MWKALKPPQPISTVSVLSPGPTRHRRWLEGTGYFFGRACNRDKTVDARSVPARIMRASSSSSALEPIRAGFVYFFPLEEALTLGLLPLFTA